MEAPGRVVEASIERVVPGGDGLARVEGQVALVAGALPGDRVRIQAEAVGPRLLRGRLLDVLEPGPARRPEDEICPRARDGSCGGCDWPAARLEAHEALKKEIVLDALRRLGGLASEDVPTPRWVGSPRGYRLRNRLHVDGLGRVGFFAPVSHDVSDLETCEIVSPAFLSRLPAVRAALREAGGFEGELTTLEGADGQPLLGQLRPARPLSDPQGLARALLGPLDGVRVLSPEGGVAASAGPTALELSAGGARYRVSVSSFFQGNRHLLDSFLAEIRGTLGQAATAHPLRRALDLYAGVGFLTYPLAQTGATVTAVEADASAAADLAANVESFRREGWNVRAVESTAERYLKRQKDGVDLVVADPPRQGLSPAVRTALLRAAPMHLLLVSCDPATLARDLGTFKGRYRLESLVLLDLFPGTHHVESLVLLARREGRGG